MQVSQSSAILQFYRLIATARSPQRADRAAAGTLPTRAHRYCEAVTSAASFGWWVFPPIDLQFIWDGHNVFWYFEGADDWIPLTSAAQFPDFSSDFDKAAPAALKGCAPPFLTVLPEPGMVQIWTGLMARTADDWSLLVRAPANLPQPGGYAVYEGIVETDRWFGPLFTNLRLTQTHRPVVLRADVPLLQVQPLPRIAYADTTLSATSVIPELAKMQHQDWQDYQNNIVAGKQDPDRAFGSYAVAVRKRRKSQCPYAKAAA